jgi:DNA helicase-2/ATP-dependent DNA helicase PcrA
MRTSASTKSSSPPASSTASSPAPKTSSSAPAYAKLATGKAQAAAAKVYPVYQGIPHDAGALDFDDLIFRTVEMFRNIPRILAKYQQQFQYIMVDEYQDTNHAQYQITKLLAAGHHNICVVGDDWQAFTPGAAPISKTSSTSKKTIPTPPSSSSSKITAPPSASSTPPTPSSPKTACAPTKSSGPTAGDGAGIGVINVYNEIQEAEPSSAKSRSSASAEKRELYDFAVLYRTNAQSRSLEEAFLRYNLPYKIVGGTRFYERKEIKDALAYLRFVYQPDDVVSFGRIINLPPRGLGRRLAARLEAWRTQANYRPHGRPAAAPTSPRPPDQGRQRPPPAVRLRLLIDGLRAEPKSSPSARSSTWSSSAPATSIPRRQLHPGRRPHRKRQRIAVRRRNLQRAHARGFLEEIALIADIDNYSESTDAVTLMTLHAAKGLEFPVVFIPGMEEGIFPHSRALFDGEQMEEERRLCYVGMTRAKERLYPALRQLAPALRLHQPQPTQPLPARNPGRAPRRGQRVGECRPRQRRLWRPLRR